MVASMLVMAISFTWDGGQHVGDGHQCTREIWRQITVVGKHT
jgi:hypothetical protein